MLWYAWHNDADVEPPPLIALQGRCLACNSNRVIQSGRCFSAISCKGRRIQSGSQAGGGCRCLDAACHWCDRVASGDTCRVCRDGTFLADGACVTSCPATQASSGVGLFKRRCADPFTCNSGRLVGQTVNYGCKCATEDNSAIAPCQTCEHRAGEHGQHCTKCNGGTVRDTVFFGGGVALGLVLPHGWHAWYPMHGCT